MPGGIRRPVLIGGRNGSNGSLPGARSNEAPSQPTVLGVELLPNVAPAALPTRPKRAISSIRPWMAGGEQTCTPPIAGDLSASQAVG